MSSAAAEAFPDGVPITVPDAWKRATLATPVPVVRCTYIFPDTHDRPGEQCGRWSLRGALLCIKHGGRLPTVRQHAEAVVEAARLRLVGSADMAVDVIEDLAQNSISDAVRLKAAESILDRVGVRGGVEIDVQVDDKRDPSDVLRDRINTLRQRTIEGELVRREDEALVAQALEAATNEEVSVTVEPDEVPNMEDS